MRPSKQSPPAQGGLQIDPLLLKGLQDKYDADTLLKATLGVFKGMDPGGIAFPNAVVTNLYTGAPLNALNRERALVLLLACRGEELALAFHMYWALMEGMGFDELLGTLRLVGAYEGLPSYLGGLEIVKQLLEMLGKMDPNDLSSAAVVQALLTSF
jgi:hypothetical protein